MEHVRGPSHAPCITTVQPVGHAVYLLMVIGHMVHGLAHATQMDIIMMAMDMIIARLPHLVLIVQMAHARRVTSVLRTMVLTIVPAKLQTRPPRLNHTAAHVITNILMVRVQHHKTNVSARTIAATKHTAHAM